MGILMDPIYIVLVLAIGFVSLWFLAFYKRSRHHLPPGPKGLPFIGNAWQIDPVYTFLDITTLGKKYGDIFKITMYGHDIIVLSGDELLHRALVTDSLSFAGRPRNVRVDLITGNAFRLALGDYSERVKVVKKLLLNCMKMYGDGLQRLENLVAEMNMELFEKCQKTNGQPHNFEDEFFNFMMNIMMSLGCGSLMTREDVGAYVETEKMVLHILQTGSTSMIFDFFPWLRHLPLGLVKYAKVYLGRMKELFDPFIEEKEESFDGKNTECIVDAMLKLNMGLCEEEEFTKDDIRHLVLEICGAGISTSTSTLRSFLAHCIVKPEIQRKIQTEIDRNVGSRAPKLEDKKKMPYLEAAILETLRLSSNVPLLLPHKTTSEVEIKGYKIPKHTEVWINAWSHHHDERYWYEPWAFKPERFLSKDGSIVPPDHMNRKRLLAFGAGRRVCVGEAMAKGRLFLLISTLLQRFTVLPESDKKLPNIDPRHQIPSLVLRPPPYKMRMIPRI